MKIKEVTVNAGRTLPHPTESYANIRSDITLRADLDEGEDPGQATKRLQVMAERMVEEHSAVLLSSIQERHVSELERQRINRLEKSIAHEQQELGELQQRQAARETEGQLMLFGEAATDCGDLEGGRDY